MKLDSPWCFTQIASKPHFENIKEEWQECGSFPTSVHVELRRLGKIPDPFKGLAEWDVQCEIFFLAIKIR